MNDHATSSYRQAAARGATPVGQVVVLYDTILRDFFRALAALKAGHIEARVKELNHAINVIGYLLGVLDYERGGRAARQLGMVYRASIATIVKANAQVAPGQIEELIEMYGELRQAWYEADRKLASEAKTASASLRPGGGAEGGNPQRHWSS
jgi:flagellar secretion chaperone FliS